MFFLLAAKQKVAAAALSLRNAGRRRRLLDAAATTVERCARRNAAYVQGQAPEPHLREYFYYIDHQGQVTLLDFSDLKMLVLTLIIESSCACVAALLMSFFCQLFLDDTKVKNFITCFKDKQFLVFFFTRLRPNETGRYQDQFPFLALCGRERNFLRCDDRPLVFTHMLPGVGLGDGGGASEMLSFCGGGDKLTAPFRPEALFMHPRTGRLYHPCANRAGSVGLVRSALAFELSPHFEYPPDQPHGGQPTHFLWAGERHSLTNELARHFPEDEEELTGTN
uniref:Chromosome 8 open reading frame 82 n=1 Tax=Paramormyrops kingsleyae TaxID=1676925 RepID=A0A3B3S545_9TELE